MNLRWIACAVAFLASGCLGGDGIYETEPFDFSAEAREKAAAAVAAGRAPKPVWQAQLGTHASDFFREVGGDTLIVGRTDVKSNSDISYRKIAAYDAASGKLLWQRKRQAKHTTRTEIVAASPEPVILYSGEGETIEALNRRTGEVIWSREFEYRVFPVPVPAAGLYLVTEPSEGFYENSLIAYSLTTGKKLWEQNYRNDGYWANLPLRIFARGNSIYVLGKTLFRVDPRNGKPVWETKLGRIYIHDLQADGQRVVAYGVTGYSILDAKSGALIAKKPTPAPVGFAALTENRILIGSGDDRMIGHSDKMLWTGGQLTGLDRQTGKKVWDFDLYHPVKSTLLFDQGRLIFATPFRLIGIDLNSGKLKFEQPLPQVTVQNFRLRLGRLTRTGNVFVLTKSGWGSNAIVARASDGKLLHMVDIISPERVEALDRTAIAAFAANRGTIPMATLPVRPAAANESFPRRMQAHAKGARVGAATEFLIAAHDHKIAVEVSTGFLQSVSGPSAPWDVALINFLKSMGDRPSTVAVAVQRESSLKEEPKFRGARELAVRSPHNGLSIRWVERDGLAGIDFLDFANDRHAFIAVSPAIKGYKRIQGFDDSYQPVEISRDGRMIYAFGYGFDSRRMAPTRKIGKQILPAASILAIDVSAASFAPIDKDDLSTFPLPKEKSESSQDKPWPYCKRSFTAAIMDYAASHGDLELLQQCVNENTDFDLGEVPLGYPQESTFMMAAAFAGEDAVVEIQHSLGYDPKKRNAVGLNAIDYARLGGHKKLATKMLLMPAVK